MATVYVQKILALAADTLTVRDNTTNIDGRPGDNMKVEKLYCTVFFFFFIGGLYRPLAQKYRGRSG